MICLKPAFPALCLPPVELIFCSAALPLRDMMKVTSFESQLKAVYKLQGVTSMPMRDFCKQRGTWWEVWMKSNICPQLNFYQLCFPWCVANCLLGLSSSFQKCFSWFYISVWFLQFSARLSETYRCIICLPKHYGVKCLFLFYCWYYTNERKRPGLLLRMWKALGVIWKRPLWVWGGGSCQKLA